MGGEPLCLAKRHENGFPFRLIYSLSLSELNLLKMSKQPGLACISVVHRVKPYSSTQTSVVHNSKIGTVQKRRWSFHAYSSSAWEAEAGGLLELSLRATRATQ